MRTLRALALAALVASVTAPAAQAACHVGTLVCTQTRTVGGVTGPWCVHGAFGTSGHYQTVWC